MFFYKATIKGLIEESKLSMTESAKRIGAMWTQLEDKDKAVYNKMHEEDVER